MKKGILISLSLVTLLLVLTACQQQQKADEYMVIGMPLALTGSDAYIGEPPRLFMQDYVDKINAEGGLLGKKLKVVAYDIAADNATEAVNATNRFISQDKVFAIVGPTGSAAAIPMAPIVNAAKIPTIVPTATNEKVTVQETGELNPYMFRVCFIDNYQGSAAAYYAYEKLGYRKVGIFDAIGDPYSQGISDYFEQEFIRLGGTITRRMSVNEGDVEFRPQLSAMAETNPEAIFCPAGSYVRASFMINQSRELGIDVPYIMADANYDDALLEVCGPNVNGSLLTNGLYADSPEYAEFQADFAKKHPEWNANIYVLYTYDCAELLVWAVKQANSFDGPAIQKALASATNVKLFTDPSFTIDPLTHNPLNKTVAIIGVENEKWVLVDTFRPD
ncbi:MAG: ABC transporter substrate-binding protein [Symbiobacteriaceae bacterium]|nr:ABC transporter substrate-binding protein [Symbiobacteriaceae bacterium]